MEKQLTKRGMLTEREKAVISWAAAYNVTDWSKIYLLSRLKDPESYVANSPNFPSTVSEWKRSYKVKSYYLQAQEEFRARVKAAVQLQREAEDRELAQQFGTPENPHEGGPEGDGEGNATKRKTFNKKDYTDVNSALAELNSLANKIDDAKAKADAIIAIQKLASQVLSPADGHRDEIKRFYLALRCQDCELYRKASERLKKSQGNV